MRKRFYIPYSKLILEDDPPIDEIIRRSAPRPGNYIRLITEELCEIAYGIAGEDARLSDIDAKLIDAMKDKLLNRREILELVAERVATMKPKPTAEETKALRLWPEIRELVENRIGSMDHEPTAEEIKALRFWALGRAKAIKTRTRLEWVDRMGAFAEQLRRDIAAAKLERAQQPRTLLTRPRRSAKVVESSTP